MTPGMSFKQVVIPAFFFHTKRNLMAGKYRPQAETIFIKTREEE